MQTQFATSLYPSVRNESQETSRHHGGDGSVPPNAAATACKLSLPPRSILPFETNRRRQAATTAAMAPSLPTRQQLHANSVCRLALSFRSKRIAGDKPPPRRRWLRPSQRGSNWMQTQFAASLYPSIRNESQETSRHHGGDGSVPPNAAATACKLSLPPRSILPSETNRRRQAATTAAMAPSLSTRQQLHANSVCRQQLNANSVCRQQLDANSVCQFAVAAVRTGRIRWR